MAKGDTPVPLKYNKSFGYKMAWLAIRSEDSHAVIDALGLSAPQEVNWEKGIKTVYEDMSVAGRNVFITPPIDGWTLVVGDWTGHVGEGFPGLEKFLARLNARFGEAQGFSTHRAVEDHHWVLARNGALLRSFAYLGASGALLSDKGDLTPIESSLNINIDVPEDYDPFSDAANIVSPPNERDVMAVAGAWSVDPTTLDQRPDVPETVILARTPVK